MGRKIIGPAVPAPASELASTPASDLRALWGESKRLDARITAAVSEARYAGRTWEEIGLELRMPGERARRRWAGKVMVEGFGTDSAASRPDQRRRPR